MNSKQLKYAEIFSFLAFIFFLMFIFLSNEEQKLQASIQEYQEESIDLEEKYQETSQQNKTLEGKIEELNQEIQGLRTKLEGQGSKRGTYPPNIVRSDAEGKNFESGKAELTDGLRDYISGNLVDDIKKTFEDYPNLNTIEVIGHTDGVEIKKVKSNLDKLLSQVANDNEEMDQLKAGSNADLGLMRALAVVKALQQEEELLQLFENKGIPKNKVFRAYSAAQLYQTDGKLAPPDNNPNKERRRIEIRFTQLKYN